MIEQLNETTEFIRSRYPHKPVVGIVLGSGLGNFASGINIEAEISYSEIPNFPVSTVEGHQGKLILGEMGGKKIVAMAGRFHFYEGYKPEEVVFPVRVMKWLGVETLLLSNAAGGVDPSFKVGDLMVIKDHISFATVNPLLGKNHEEFGPRFPDMSEPYDKQLIKLADKIADQLDISLKSGVYFGVTGPTFETRAEYQMIRILGGSAVGMSTVQEVITAIHMGMKVFAMSVITDIGIRDEDNVITHEEVLQAAKEAEPKLTAVFQSLVAAIS
ncbi:MAG: purine-nucleoside phosphorylase [Chitinophagaceae bacterium]|nr:MAG: purine-nucleoside phosphorylase [Chitinophagaceae bacterium]